MKSEFDEFDEFFMEEDNSDDFSFQDNYYYDENSSFDSTLEDYDYLDYNYNKLVTEEESYETNDSDDSDDIYDQKSKKRIWLVRAIIFLIILFLIIWFISLIFNSNSKKIESNDDIKVIKTDNIDYETMFLKVKDSALKYYTEKETTDSINIEKTLKLLKSLEYIDINSEDFNLNRSYIKLTENTDSNTFNILVVLVHNSEQKSKSYEVSNYSYCIDSYLCEKKQILGMEENEEEEFDNNNINNIEIENKNETKLSSWSLWSNYERTSCNTKEIKCDENDSDCLMELKLYEQKEKIDTYDKLYSSSRIAFSNVEKEDITACNNYDYIKINESYYRIDKYSYYTVLGAITKDTRSNYYNWRYDGRTSYEAPPSDTEKTRYVYVEPDYSNCTNTCQNNPKYYYDKYTFTVPLTKSKNPGTDCKNLSTKTIANYSISKQMINVSRKENLYGTVCYKSIRTRKKI